LIFFEGLKTVELVFLPEITDYILTFARIF